MILSMTENLWYYKLLDFPPLPEQLVQQLDQLIEQKLLGMPGDIFTPQAPRPSDGYINVINYKDASEEQLGQIIYHELPWEFQSWVNDNITDQYLRIKFSIHHGKIAPPHTDYLREYGINYIHVLGGDNVKTVWYQEHGHPVVRPGRHRQPDYAKLTVLDEIVLPAGQWHVLRTDILHSVENLQSNRVRIAIDLNESMIDRILF